MADQQRAFWEAGGIYRGSHHPVVELFARQRMRHLERRGLLAGVRTVLDVGAGCGFSSAYYPPDVRVVAADYARGMIEQNPVPERLRCSADALAFADATFDLVTCWELLHHLPDPVAAIREMVRVARRRVIMFEPNRINPGHMVLAALRDNERESIRFSPGHVRRLVGRAGARLAHHERCGLLFPNITPLPVAKLLVRLPFRVPLIAISQLAVIEKTTLAR
jgi:SAM-dependent methyltransferase